MNDDRKEIEKIQQRLQISKKQIELLKADQRQFFLNRWLQRNPELQSINIEIARLERRESDHFKILQNAASIPPEKDWSKSLFYSHTVRCVFGAETPFDQYGLYISAAGGMFLVLRSLFRSYHALKAVEFAPKTEDRRFHSYLARATEEQLLDAKLFAHQLRTKGILSGLLFPIGFIAYILNKQKK